MFNVGYMIKGQMFVKTFSHKTEALNYANLHDGYLEFISERNLKGYTIQIIAESKHYYSIQYIDRYHNYYDVHNVVDNLFSTYEEAEEEINRIKANNKKYSAYVEDESNREYNIIPVSRDFTILPIYRMKFF